MRILMAAAFLLAACGQTTTEAPTPPAPASPSPAAWETQLTQMLPYIDACIAASPQTRTISFAGLLDDQSVVVRMGGESGEFTCTVPTANPTAANAVIAMDDETVSYEGEGSAIFVRGPGANPGGECYEAPEVRNADGEVIGWMLDPDGC